MYLPIGIFGVSIATASLLGTALLTLLTGWIAPRYDLRALLIFYLTQHWLFNDSKSNLIYGAYTALVYITPVLGEPSLEPARSENAFCWIPAAKEASSF